MKSIRSLSLLSTAIRLLLLGSLFSSFTVSAGAPLVASFIEQVNKFAVNPNNNEIYASTPTSVLIIDGLSLKKIAEIDVSGSPQGLAVSLDGKKLYVATSAIAQLAVIDLQTRTLGSPIALPHVPFDVVVGNSDRLYVSPGNTSGYKDLLQVNASNGAYSAYVNNSIFMYYNSMLQISPDRNTLYIGNDGLSPSSLYKLNISTASPSLLTSSRDLGGNGQDLCIDGTGEYIYYAMGSGNEVLTGYDVARIRTSDLTAENAMLTGPYPREVAIHPDNVTLFTVTEAGYIGIWDVVSLASKGTITTLDKEKLAVEARELIVDLSGRYLFAAFEDALRVYRVSSKAINPPGMELSSRDGSAVAVADMNADTVEDFVSGAPYADVSAMANGKNIVMKDAGKIHIRSGSDGSMLRQLSGTAAGQRFGTAFVVVSDQNSDGVPDLVVGEPLSDVQALVNGKPMVLKDAGRVAIYSGSSGELLTVVVEGALAGDRLGVSVALGDVDNDAQADLVVGASGVDVVTMVQGKTVTLKDAGRVFVHDGISNSLLYSRSGVQAGESLGSSVAVDAQYRLYVGSGGFDVTSTVNGKLVKLANAGQVQVFAGANGADPALLIVPGSVKGNALGASVAVADDDLNGDTQQDWFAGEPLADPSGLVNGKNVVRKDAGRILVFSGLSSTPVAQIDGETAGDNSGAALFASADLDADNVNDVVSGEPGHDAIPLDDGVYVKLKDAGKTGVISGADIFQ